MNSSSSPVIDGLTLESITQARCRLRNFGGDLLWETPIIRSRKVDRDLSEKVGRDVQVFFKCEHLQPVGAFKIRGALNFALLLDPQVRARGLVTHSSGNHGAAVAQAGQFLRVPVVVVVPQDAAVDKVERMKFYGAEIVFCEPNIESRMSVCADVLRKRGGTEIPPFNHAWTMSGQGTVALEANEQIGGIDAYMVAVGGCGLISGILVAAKAISPNVLVFGAEPSAVDDTALSLREGQRRGPSDPSATTICDALRVINGPLCFEVVSRLCDGVFTVSDAETIEGMRLIARELKQVTEPAGAVATAALFSSDFVFSLKRQPSITRICVVICGGNISIETIKELI